jgi:S-adenosylmethionine:tRNA ribosyltransferase-isomerase
VKIGHRLNLDAWISAEVEDKEEGGRIRIRFSEPLEPHLDRLGHVPLPPYIRRSDDTSDKDNYQTIFAQHPGAIAAPTAGLHFDSHVLAVLARQGTRVLPVTLHVGIGTFRPVTAELARDHKMDAERFSIGDDVVAAVGETRRQGGRVVAVGTTVVRTLEGSAAASGTLHAGSGSTDLFIVPGFRFQVVDALITNFHLPRSTLLMLVSAFAGRQRVLAAYRQAVEERYRFYSYGDAMFLPSRMS